LQLWLPRPLRAATTTAFSPYQVSAVSSWLRLDASLESGGEWEEISDVLNGASPVTQGDSDRRSAVGTSANGYPTAVFDGTDVHVWPLTAANNGTTKLGFWIWFKPASVASVQHLVSIVSPTASAQKLDIYANNAQVFCECYISGTAGRFGRTGNVLSAGAWRAIYVQYDSNRGGDANLAIFIGGVSQSLTYGNLGAGGTLTTLPVVTGNALIGGLTNSDTPSQPIANGGEIGPNLFAFSDNLTAAQIAALLLFEAPT
jgi:hypothetical protein